MKKTYLRKLAAAMMALVMVLAVASMGIADEVKPEEEIAGYYSFAYTYGETGTEVNPNFYHFYAPDPVFGNLFTAEFAYNQVNYAGTYTIEQKDFPYNCSAIENGKKSENTVEGVAPYTVTLCDMDGTPKDVCGFDGSKFYACGETFTFQGVGNCAFLKETPEESVIGDYLNGEVAVLFYQYDNPEDESSFVTFNVKKTYTDMMDIMDEGTYEIEKGENGLLTYKMSSGAVLAENDAATATYTAADGTTTAVNKKGAKQILGTFAGNMEFSGMPADVRVDLLDKGNCEVYISVFGNEMLVVGGTYENNDGTYTFVLQSAGEAATTTADNATVLHYVNTVEALGLSMDLDLILQ